jgi:hypothetical protein
MHLQSQESVMPKRKEAMVRQLADEFVVYDQQSKRAHCLNQTAGEVWGLCDGRTSIGAMIQKLGTDKRTAVWMALEEIEKAGLLENPLAESEEADLARRNMIRKMGIAAAIAVPVIASVLVPTPARAAS